MPKSIEANLAARRDNLLPVCPTPIKATTVQQAQGPQVQ